MRVVADACIKFGVERFVLFRRQRCTGIIWYHLRKRLLYSTTPYRETKAINERILTDVVQANPDLGVSLRRYFNLVGVYESGLIGEAPMGF